MAGGKEIRDKIKSVESTRKITKAMEMVATSKMRKAQDRMRAARPYSTKIRNIAGHLSEANPDYSHPFLLRRNETRRAGFIVVTTDKGLCGAMNTNILRAVTHSLRDFEGNGIQSEMVAIGNCTDILTDSDGAYKLSASEASAAWKDLTLYTNAESCPMCASAIRWAGFKEYVYGTSIGRLIETGWGQIDIESSEVFKQSWNLGTSTKFVSEVLTNETDPYFLWQFQADYPCPGSCSRGDTGRCQES